MSHPNRSLRSAFLVAAAIALGATEARAADIQKDNNQTALNVGTSFVGGSVPSGTDMVVFDSLYSNGATGTSINYGAALTVSGFTFGAMSGTAGQTLTLGNDATQYQLNLGAGGINASASTMNIVLGTLVNVTANQTWTLNGGRNLRLGNTASSSVLTGSADITLAQAGSGTATFDINGVQASGANGFSGNWYVGSNVLLRNASGSGTNGSAAWGTGRVYLNGGTIASGEGAFSYGTFYWGTDMVVQSLGGTIDNNNVVASGRALTLNSHIAGGGALTFANTAGYAVSTLVTAGNSYTGGTTIAAGAYVNLGNGTVNGTLGSGGITITSTNTGALNITRRGTTYLANNISGVATARLDLNIASGVGIVYLTGTNTYGGTTALNTAGSYISVGSINTNVGAGSVAFVGGSLIYTGGGETTTRGLTWGGVTSSSVFANGVGALVWNPGSAISYNGTTNTARTFVFGGTSTALNTLGGANATIADNGTGASSFTKTNVGTWVLNQLQTYTGTTTIAGGTLRLDFVNGTAGVIKSGNALTFSQAGTLELYGKSATTSAQTLGAITLTAGNATFLNTLNGASGLTLTTGALARSAGATAVFDSSSGGSIGVTNTATNGIIGPWAFIKNAANDFDYVTPGASNATAVSAYTGYTILTAAGGGSVGGTNYAVTGNLTLSGATVGNVLKLVNNSTTTLALGANALSLGNAATAAGGLLVSGSGTGGTTISGSAAIGNTTGEFILNNSSASTLTITAPLINAAATGIAGSLTKTGAGTVIINSASATTGLANSNAFSGAVSVNQGELQALLTSPGTTTALATGTYTPLGTGAITVGAGATLRFKAASTTNAYTFANAINLRDGTLISDDGVSTYSGAINSTGWSAIQTTTSGRTATFSGVISGSGFLDLSAPGSISLTSALNTFTGYYNLKSGTLVLGAAADRPLGTAAGLIVNAGATATLDRSAAATVNLFASGNTTSVVELRGTSLSAATLDLTQTYTGAGTATSFATFPKLTLNYGTITAGSSSGPLALKFVGAVETVSGTTNTVNLTAGTNSRAILFDGEVSGFGSLALDRGASGASVVSSIGFRNNLVGFGGNITVNDATASGITFFGGAGGWGSGTLTLAGAGSTTVLGDASGNVTQAGTVTTGIGTQASGLGAYGSIMNIQGGATLNAGATLQVLNQSATAYIGGAEIAGTVNLNGGTLSQYGSYSTTPAFIPFTNATWVVGGSSVSTISAPIALNYSGVTFNVGDSVAGSGTDLLVSGVIRGSQQLTKSGIGTMTLTAANTATANFNVATGTLRLDYVNGTASIINSGNGITFSGTSTLELFGKSAATNSQTLGAITLSGGNATFLNTLNGATGLTLTMGAFGGANRSTGATAVFDSTTGAGAAIGVTNTATNGIIGPWAFIRTGTSTYDYAVPGASNAAAVTALASSTALPTTGGGGATNNYASALSGTAITLAANTAANTVRLTSHTASATLALSTYSLTTGGLLLTGANSGATTITGSGVLGNGTGEFVLNNSSGSTLTIQSGFIGAGAGSFIKTGAGTVILQNATAAGTWNNSFTGNIYVNQGEFQVREYYASAIMNTGTYTGALGGAITVNAGATLRFWSGASSANTYTYANNLTLRDATLINQDGKLVLGGTVAMSGSNTVNVYWNTKDITLNGVVSGSGALTLASTSGGAVTWTSGTSTIGGTPGTLVLGNAANTYTGTVTLNSATSLNAQGVATALGAASQLTINSGASLLWDRAGSSSSLFTSANSTVDLKGVLWAYHTESNSYSTVTLTIPNLLLDGGVYIAGGSSGAIVSKQVATLTAVTGTTTNLVHSKNGGWNQGMTFSGSLSGSGAIVMTRETGGSNPHWMGLTGNTSNYTGAISVASTTTGGAYFFSGTNLWGSGTLTATGSGATAVLGDVLYNINTSWAAQGSRTGTFTTSGSLVVGESGQVNLLNQASTDVVSAEIGGSVALNGGTLGLYGSYATPGAFIPLASATWTVGGSAVSTISAPLSFNYSGVIFNVGDSVAGSGVDLLVSGAVRGDKQLTKSGVGTMALTAANTTSGGFNVTAGTLNVGNAGTTGDLGTGMVAIGASGTVTIARSNDVTLANTFTGAGALSKSASSGVTTLSGNLAAFTGTIAVATGTAGATNVLALGSATNTAAASTITVAQYAALRSTGSATVGNVTLASGGSLQIIAGTPTTSTAFFTASGAVAFAAGSNVVIANTLAIGEGTYRLLNYSAGSLTYGGNTDITGLTATALASSRNVFTFSNDTTNKTLDLIVTGVAGNIVWNGAFSTWDAAKEAGVGKAFNNSAANPANPDYPADYFYNYDAVTFDDTGAANTTVNLSGALTPGNITVDGSQTYVFGGSGSLTGVANITKNGSGTLRLENTTANSLSGTITVNGGKLAVSAGFVTLSSGGLVLNNGATFAAAATRSISQPLTVNGAVTLGDATDAGALTFSGTNNIAASATVNGAVNLTFSGTNTFAAASSVSTTGTLAVSGTTNFGVGSGLTSTGAMTISGTNTFGNGVALSAGAASTLNSLGTTTPTSVTFAGAGAWTLAGNVALAGNTTVTVNGAGGTSFSGVVSNAFTLTKAGDGKLTLNGANTNSGGITVNAGTVQLGANNTNTTAVYAGTLTINSGGTFIWARSAGNWSNAITGAGTFQYQGNGNATLSAASTFSGTWLIKQSDTVGTPGYLGFANDAAMGAGSNFQLDGGGFYFSATGQTMAATRTITLLSGGGVLNGSSGHTQTIAAKITGAGLLTKVSGASMSLTNANDYTGGTAILTGNLVAANATAFGTGTVTVGGGTLGTNTGVAQFADGITVANNFSLATQTGGAGRGMLEAVGTATGGTSGLVTINVTPTNGTHFATDSGATLKLLGGISSASTAVTFGAGNYILGDTSSYATASLASGSIKLGSANGLAAGSIFTMGTGASASTLDLNGYSQSSAVTLATGSGGLTITNTSTTAGSVNLANTGNIGLNITGNTALVLSGLGSKNLTGTNNTYTGGTTVAAGTLDLTTIAGLGSGSLTISTGAGVSLTSASAVSFGVAISGAGSFDKNGAQSLTLAGDLSGFTGALNINAGSLVIASGALGGSTGGPVLNVGSAGGGAALSGSFTTSRDLKVWNGSTLRASTGQTVGNLVIANGAVLDLGADLYGGGTAQLNVLIGDGVSDVVNVTAGALVLSGNVSVTFINGGFGSGRYNFLTYDVNNPGNSLGRTVSLSSATYGHTAISEVGHDTVAGAFYVDVTKASMIWLGGTGDVDATTANFKLSTTGAPDFIYQGDELVFDDTASTRVVNLTGTNPSLGKITVDTAAGYTFAGTGGLAGDGAQLIKKGAGVLNLGGANTFNGGIVVNGGTLAVAADAPLGAVSGGITLGAGTTLQATETFTLGSTRAISLAGGASISVDTGKTLTYAGSIAGSYGLTKAGNGTLLLNGSNAFSGGTTVNAGTLQLGSNNALNTAGAVTVNAGTLDIGATSQTVGAVTVAGGAVTGSGTLTFSTLTATNNGDATLSSVLAGLGSTLSKSGTGALTLSAANTFTGGATLNAGVIRVGNAAALGTGTLTLNGGELSSASTTAYTLANTVVVGGDVSLGDTTNTGALTLGGAVSLGGGNRTLTVDSAVTISGVITNGGLIKAGLGTLTLTGANTYSGDTVINAGTLSQSSNTAFGGSITVGSAGTLAFTRSTGGGALANNISGAGTITFTGGASGELGLTGSNDFSGTISIVSGKLAFAGASSATGAPIVTIATGASLSLGDGLNGGTAYVTNLSGAGNVNGTWGGVAGTRRLSVNTTADSTLTGVVSDGSAGRLVGLTKTGDATLNLNATNTFTGGTTVTAGTLATNNNTGFGAAANAVTLSPGASNAALLINYNVTAAQPITVSGSGAGTATIGSLYTASSGLNTQFSGTITLGRDVILLNNTGDRTTFAGKITGTGNVTISSPNTGGRVAFAQSTAGAASDFVGNITIAASTQLQVGVGSNTSNYAIPDTASIYFTNATSYLRLSGSGGTAAESVNALISNAAGAGLIQATESNGTLTIGAGNGSGVFSGVIGLSGAFVLNLTKVGTGNQTLSGANTFIGTTTLTGGTLTLGNSAALGMSTLALNGGTLALDPTLTSFTFGGLSAATAGAGYDISLSTAEATPRAIALTVGANNGSTSYAGVLSGLGSLTKTGTGALTLTNAGNTYSGGTSISAGTLRVGGDTVLGSGAVTLSGGALSSDSTTARTLANNLVFAGNATLGDGTNTGALTINGTVDLGGASRTVTVASAVTLANTVSNGALVKSGTGTLTVSAVNNYTGGTTLTGGTLAQGAGATLGSGAITFSAAAAANLQLTISDSTAYTLSQDIVLTNPGSALNYILYKAANATPSLGTLTVSGNISGGGANTVLFLNNSAADSLTSYRLSGNNTFQGTVRLNRGNLLIGAASDLGAAGNTLYLDSYQNLTDGSVRFLNDVNLTQGVVLSYATVGINTGAYNVGLSGAISGTHGLQKIGSGTLTLSGAATYGTTSNVTTIAEGTVALVGGANRLSAGTTLTLGAAATTGSLVLGDASGAVTQSVGSLASSGLGGSIVGGAASASTLTVTGSSTTTFAGTIGGAGSNQNNVALAYGGTGALTLSAANTFAGGTALSSGTLRIGNNSALGSGAVTLSGGALSSDSTTARTLANNLVFAGNATLGDGTNAGTLTINGTVDLGGATRILTTASAVTLAGAISNGGLSKAGSGALTLTNANSYSGGTALSLGTLRVGSDSALGSGAVTLSGGALSSDSTTARALANNLVFNGNATLGDATNNGALTINGTIDLGNASRTLAVASAVTLANTVSNGTLVKDGVGALTLSTANSLTAVTLGNGTANTSATATATASSGGFVVIGNAGALGSGTVTLKGTQIQAGVSGLTIANPLTIDAGALRFSGSNDLTMSGAITLVTGATRGIANYSTTANLTLQSAIDLGANGLIFQGSSAGSAVAAKIILNGAISGASGISTDSSYANRTVELNGATSYTGATTVAGGTVNIASGSTLASNASISAGTLKLSNGTRLTGTVTLSSTGRLEMAGGTAGAITVGAGQSLVISGGTNTLTSVAMSGSGSFNATGGTLNVGQLNAAASATGTTWTIASGATVNATNVANNYNPASYTVDGTLNLSSTAANAFNQSTNGTMTVGGTGTINIAGGFTSTNNTSSLTFITVGRMNIGGGAGGTAVAGLTRGAGVLVLGSATAAGTIGIYSRDWSSTSTMSLGTAGVTFNTLDSVDGVTGRTITLSGVLGDYTGNVGKLTKAGAGTLNLSANNTFSGAVAATGGTLNIGGAHQSVASFAASNSGTAINFNTTNFLVAGHGTAVAASRTLSASDGGSLVFASTIDARIGNVSLSGGTFTSNRGLTGYDILLGDVSTGAATVTVGGTAASTMNGTGGLHLLGVQNFDVADATGSSAADLIVSLQLANSGTLGANTAGGINKTGQGTMSLTNASNSFTGAITIGAGTLDVGGSGLLNAGSYAGNISNNGALSVSTSGTQTLSGVINGSGSLAKSGAGNLTLSNGSNAFSGGVTVSGGTLTASANGALSTGAVSVTGGTLDIGSTTQSVGALTYTGGSISGTGRINASSYSFGDNSTLASGLTLGGAASLTKSTNGTLTINSTLANSGGVSVSAGTLRLTAANSHTGGTSLTGGTLQVGNAGALGGAAASLALNGGKLSSDSTAARVITAAGASTIGGDVTLGDATNNGALTLTNAFDLGGATRTLTAASNATLSGVLSNGGLTKAGNGTLTLSGANTYAGATNVNGGTLVLSRADAVSSASAVTIGAGGTLSLNYALGSGDAITRTFSGSGILDLALTGYTSTLTGLSGFNGTLRLSTGTVFDSYTSGWNGNLIFAGGSLAPAALANYTGTVTVQAGTTVNAADGLPANVVVASGATIDFTGATGSALAATITYAGGTLTNATNYTGNLVISGSGVNISGTSLGGSGATLVVGSGSSVNLSGDIANTLNVTGGSVNLGGSTSGNLVLTSGTVTGGSNFTGNLVVSSGSVGIGSGGAIDGLGATAKVTLSGGTLDLSGSSLSGTNTIEYTGGTIAGGSNFTGTVAVQTGSTLANAGTLGGTVAVQSGATVANTGTLTGTVSVSGGTLTNAGTVAGPVTVTSGSLVNNGTVTGATVVKSGGTLSGNGTFAGTTIESGASLSPGNSPGIQTYTSTLTINGGATIVEQIYSDVALYTAGALAGKRGYDTIVVNGSLNLSGASSSNKITLELITLSAWDSSTAAIPGVQNLAFTKDANGNWIPKDFTLATYSGQAILAAGENITTIFAFDIDGFYYSSGVNAATIPASMRPWGDSFWVFERDIGGGNYELTLRVVPEPSTYGLILGGLALVAAAIRRRKRKA